MATIAELERLAALTEKLIPISQFKRGTLIRADDWNALATTVIDLARAVLLDTESTSVSDHEHPDGVDIGWLTPRLRTLIEQGGLSDPVASRRLVTLERNIQKLQKQIDTLLLNIGKLRSNVDEVKVNDLGREGDLTILRRRFEAQSGSQDEVMDLRKSLSSIEDNIGKALELGERITVNGEIADIKDLSERIAGLEKLRESLTGPDGNILDASAMEIRLTELQTKLVSQDQLDEALKGVRVRPPQDLVDNLKGEINDSLQEELKARFDAQLTQYDERYINTGEFSDELKSRDQILGEQTSASINDLRNQITSNFTANDSLESRLELLSSTLSNTMAERVETELNIRLDEVQKDNNNRYITSQQLNSRLAGLSTELKENIIGDMRKEFSGVVETALQGQGRELFVSQDTFIGEITASNKRIDALGENTIADINAAVTTLKEGYISNEVLDSRLQIQQEQLEGILQDRIKVHVEEQTNTIVLSSLDVVNSRLDNLDSLENRINTNTSNQLDSLRQDISKISRQTVATELQGIQNSLRTMQDQVATINKRLSEETRKAVSDAMIRFKQDVKSDLSLLQRNITRLEKRVNKIRPDGPIPREAPQALPRPSGISSTADSDFTEIEGVDPVRAKCLQDNNIRHFKELASITSEQLASLLKISEAEVKRLQLQQKAAAKLRV